MKTTRLFAIVLSAVLALSGCAPTQAESQKFQIVASTNVWGSIAAAIGGDKVEVTSIIDNANKDPHSYEATARDQLAVEKADLVIANGGGYDDFIDTMSQAAGNKQIFRASSAVTSVAWQENEHLWFSLQAVAEVAAALADTLASIDGENAQTYLANSTAYLAELTALAGEVGKLKNITNGYSYFGTEPLAVWLMADLGFADKTPAEFAEAIENETDVPPVTMKESLDLIASGKLNYLVINAQTQNSQVQQIIDAARDAGLRSVVLSEILPEGESYLTWMAANLKTLNPGM
jgi:zinc/manganese transport system substrate-binding protein